MILGQNWFLCEKLRQFFFISEMYSKIMIWANVTKFGQNFIAPQNFLGWYGYDRESELNK